MKFIWNYYRLGVLIFGYIILFEYDNKSEGVSTKWNFTTSTWPSLPYLKDDNKINILFMSIYLKMSAVTLPYPRWKLILTFSFPSSRTQILFTWSTNVVVGNFNLTDLTHPLFDLCIYNTLEKSQCNLGVLSTHNKTISFILIFSSTLF